jgi:hypothetical protein
MAVTAAQEGDMQHPRPLDIIHEYRPAGWVGGGPRCARSAEVASRAWVPVRASWWRRKSTSNCLALVTQAVDGDRHLPVRGTHRPPDRWLFVIRRNSSFSCKGRAVVFPETSAARSGAEFQPGAR